MSFLSLIVKLGADNSAFRNALKEGEVAAQGFGRRLVQDVGAKLGAMFALGAITAFTKSVIDLASKFHDLSQRVGVTAKTMQALGLSAKLEGSDVDSVVNAFGRLAKAAAESKEATKRGEELSAVFERLGIVAEGASLEQMMEQLRTFLEATPTTPKLITDMMEIFGRDAKTMIPILRNLKENMKGALLFTPEESSKLDKMGDAATKFSSNVKTAAGKLIADTRPFGLYRKIWESLTGSTPAASKVSSGVDEKTVEEILAEQQARAAEIARIEEEAKLLTGENVKAQEIEAEVAGKREQMRIDQLSQEERINELLKHRLDIANELNFAEGSRLDKARLAEKLAEIDADIIKEKKGRKDRGSGALNIFESTGDALSRLGIYLSAGQNPQVNLVKESNKLLLEIARNTRPTAQQRDIFQ
jgi:hypothetical protein